MRPIAIVCGVALCGVLHATDAEADDGSSTSASVAQEIQQLDERGRDAYQASDLEQARGLWLQALSLGPSADIALRLGRVEVALKRYRDAAEHLEYAVRQLPASTSDTTLADAKRAFAEARAHVAAVEVTTSQPELELRVDGKVVGTSPLEHVLFLETGTHEISAHLGSNSIARAVTVQSPQVYQVNLPLVVQKRPLDSRRVEPAPIAKDASQRPHDVSPPPSASESSPSPVPLIIGGTLVMAGVASGIVFRLNSNTNFDNAEQMRAQRAATGCIGAQAQSSECQALLSATESGDRARNWSTASFIVAGAALVGTATYWFWPRHPARQRNTAQLNWQVTPSLTEKGSALLLAGEF